MKTSHTHEAKVFAGWANLSHNGRKQMVAADGSREQIVVECAICQRSHINVAIDVPWWPPKLPHLWPLKLLHLAGVN